MHAECKMICLLCGEEIENDEEHLWGHIQLDHEEKFEEIQNWDSPDMIEECYNKVFVRYFMCHQCFSIYKIEIPEIWELKKYNSLRKTSINANVLCKKELRNTKTKKKYICDHHGVEIDRKLLYAIQKLNVKGYITKFCCEGHNNLNSAYISFDECMYSMLENLDAPEGWYFARPIKYAQRFDENGNITDKMIHYFDPRPCIRYKCSNNNSDYIYALNRWVDSLPSLTK